MIQHLFKIIETLSNNLKNPTELIENLIEVIGTDDPVEEGIQKTEPAQAVKSKNKKPAIKATKFKTESIKSKTENTQKDAELASKKPKKINATKADLVVDVIKNYPAGVKNSIIAEKSGLSGQVLRTALYLAKKAGRIESSGKATYIIAQSQNMVKKVSETKPKISEKVHQVVTVVDGNNKVIRKTKKAVSHKDQILSLVKNSKDSITVSTLMEITGFNRSHVGMILSRAVKEGVITRVKKGSYAGV